MFFVFYTFRLVKNCIYFGSVFFFVVFSFVLDSLDCIFVLFCSFSCE